MSKQFLGYTKVAIALGGSSSSPFDSNLNDIEVIDISSNNTKCQNLQPFPYQQKSPVGGLGFGNNPLICLRNHNISNCYSLQNGAWTPDAPFIEVRMYSAMTRSPFPNDGSKLFVTGGWGSSFNKLNSSEVLTKNGWQQSVSMPVAISSHCMVLMNSTAVIVIGGLQNEPEKESSRTFIFNSEFKVWSEGPALKESRHNCLCAMVRGNIQSADKSVIVVGGFYKKSTELLDTGSSKWRSGPELPFNVYAAVMVEIPLGGVVVIGGYGNNDVHLDTLFRLTHADAGARWEKMPQKLKTPRVHFAAFLIPDEIAKCN